MNSLVTGEFQKSRGNLPMGLFSLLLMMIPNNQIKIPPSVKMTYNLAPGQNLTIDDTHGMMYGYYEGSIDGMTNQSITDPLYHTPGNL